MRCHYFVYPQRVEDRVLEVLVRKTETIKRELGSLSKVIDDDIERRLGQGIRHRDAEQLAREIEQADLDAEKKRVTEEELEAARERQEDLKAQIERCQNLLEASRTWIGFEAAPFRDALSCSLELLGAEPLAESDGRGRADRVWTFPPLDRRAETDASWAATLDTLRAPRKQNQKLADWRREAPIRPVVFEDAGVLTEDTVHLHLEQRVAQRLLARFRSQGFIHHDLSRACLAQAADSIPRVILLGRLSLYGQGAERLHEELVPIAARWIEPSQRKGPLAAYAREAEAKTLDLLERSLADRGRRHARRGDPAQAPRCGAPATSRSSCRSSSRAPRSWRRSPSRSSGSAASGRRRICARSSSGSASASAKSSPSTRARFEQLTLDFDDEEKRQLESDMRSWRIRLEQFDRDLEREPQRIRAFYEVRAKRDRAGRARLSLAGDELMASAKLDPEILAHLEWLGFVRPTGLVVSAPALVRAGAILDRRDAEGPAAPARLRRGARVRRRAKVRSRSCPTSARFAETVLGWSFSPKGYAGTAESPRSRPSSRCRCPTTARRSAPTSPSASSSRRTARRPGSCSCRVLEPGQDFDRVVRGHGQLEASAHGRMERLLRQTGVPAGLLFNGRALRLVSAPRGESSGWLDFRVADMVQTAGRPICDGPAPAPRPAAAAQPAARAAPRRAARRQPQVPERGQRAPGRAGAARPLRAAARLPGRPRRVEGRAPARAARRAPRRGLPRAAHRHPAARLPALRRGAGHAARGRDVPALLLARRPLRAPARGRRALPGHDGPALRRLGAAPRPLPHDPRRRRARRDALPQRHGVLFDPDRFTFLEGRSAGGARQIDERIEPPLVPDGTIYRALEKLLVLDGERISYRALDVEQIGSVYETMMGFRLETATGRSVAIKAQKKQGAPTAVDLEALLAEPAAKREKWLQDRADRKLTDTVKKAREGGGDASRTCTRRCCR